MKIIDKNIAEQTRGIFRKEGGGSEWRDITPEKGSAQVLSDEEILELSELVVKIEKHYGFPCDIEWAREGGKFYIVQSRPITTLQQNHVQISTKEASEMYNLSTYEKLFHLDGMPYLVNDILMRNYAQHEALFIFDGSLWESYLPNTTVERLNQDGLLFFRDQSAVEGWVNGFNEHRENSESYYMSVLRQEVVSRADVEMYLKNVEHVHAYYIRTEFFYTDAVFERAKKDVQYRMAVEIIEHVKQEWREHLTQVFFGEESYLARLVKKLALQFALVLDDVYQYRIEELLTLFEDKQVPTSIITSRREEYVTSGEDYPTTSYVGQGVIRKYVQCRVGVDEGIATLVGTIAYSGKVAGVARVFYEGYSPHAIGRDAFVRSFNHGDILVVDTTSPRMTQICRKAAAIIADQGGMLSHAAIISRELKKPCVIGTKIATQVLHDGDLVEVDADKGVVRVLERAK